jgi:hypothetical protein
MGMTLREHGNQPFSQRNGASQPLAHRSGRGGGAVQPLARRRGRAGGEGPSSLDRSMLELRWGGPHLTSPAAAGEGQHAAAAGEGLLAATGDRYKS